MSERLDDWLPRMPVSAAHLQQPVDVLRKLVALPGFGVHEEAAQEVPNGFFEYRIGRIVATGPGGAADFPNEMYWVQEQYIRGGLTTDPIVLADENSWLPVTPGDDAIVRPLPVGYDDPVTTIFAVTNLPELMAHTHLLPPDTPVLFFTGYDRGDPTRIRNIMCVVAEDGPEFAEMVHKGVANLQGGWGLLGEANLTP